MAVVDYSCTNFSISVNRRPLNINIGTNERRRSGCYCVHQQSAFCFIKISQLKCKRWPKFLNNWLSRSLSLCLFVWSITFHSKSIPNTNDLMLLVTCIYWFFLLGGLTISPYVLCIVLIELNKDRTSIIMPRASVLFFIFFNSMNCLRCQRKDLNQIKRLSIIKYRNRCKRITPESP